MQKNNLAIILSGGEGKRFNSVIPKQFHKINNATILEVSVQKFLDSNLFKKIIIVSNKKFLKKTRDLFNDKRILIIIGGETRQKSVFNGLKESKKYHPNSVIIHDSVRPFFTEKILTNIIKNLVNHESAIPMISIQDSVRYLNGKKFEDVSKKNLKLIQTPQGFIFKKIFEAHKKYKKQDFTDDSIIFYKLEKKIKSIKGEGFNFKITTKDDYKLGKLLIKESMSIRDIKVGNGFDVHKFGNGKFLKLFGIRIPFNKSLEGHSDADVGFHTIVDAILGALSMGDIGEHFPPSNNNWKNKASIFFMKYVKKLLRSKKYQINNLDITLICEKPRVSKYKSDFIKSVSKALEIDEGKVNIKGTTTEKLGFLGREEGIACQASVTISKINEF